MASSLVLRLARRVLVDYPADVLALLTAEDRLRAEAAPAHPDTDLAFDAALAELADKVETLSDDVDAFEVVAEAVQILRDRAVSRRRAAEAARAAEAKCSGCMGAEVTHDASRPASADSMARLACENGLAVDPGRDLRAEASVGAYGQQVRSFSADERDYVAVWGAEGVTFNYTTRPYSTTGRRPQASGAFVLTFEEADDFVALALR